MLLTIRDAKLSGETKISRVTKVKNTKYRKYNITTTWSQPGAREEKICKVLIDASKLGTIHYMYVGNAVVRGENEEIVADREDWTFVWCKLMSETVRETEQQEVTLPYHQYKTNQRGVNETLCKR